MLEVVMEGGRGTISVANFVKMLDNTIAIAQGVDSVITHTRTGVVDWYVEDLRMGSLEATLVARPRRSHRVSYRDAVAEQIAETVVAGLRSVELRPTVPPSFPEPSMRRTQRLGNLIGGEGGATAFRAFVPGSVDGTETARITKRIAGNAKEALTPKQRTHSSVLGTLEIVSVHRGQVVTIYDEINRRAIRGNFDRQSQFDIVKAALGKRVTVDGVVSRNGLGDAVSVLIEEIEILPEESQLPSVDELIGSDPELTNGLSAVEFQRLIREG
jgi:hypothetical protein